MDFGGAISAKWQRSSPIPRDPIYNNDLQSDTSLQTRRIGKPRASPIPSDPEYQKPEEDPQPKPRVKAEALNIARHHQGADLALLFNPSFRIIPLGSKQGLQTPKDFGRENYRKIKEIQKAHREKGESKQKSTPVKVVHKPGKYDHIGSKVAERIYSPPAAPRPSTASAADGLRGRDSEAKQQRSSRPRSASPVPRLEKLRCGNTSCDDSKSVNHISENIKKSGATQIKRSPSLTALDDLKKKKQVEIKSYQRGIVPKYLKDRQKQWKKEEEIRKANEPDPSIPEGHSLLPEKERKKTLDLLIKSQEEMLTELRSLPVSRDTVRVKQRRESLEKKLKEIDSAMKIFSRPRVFVKSD